jgi:segregation and condensation protein B
MNIENKIEAILLFKNEPVDLATLSKLLNESRDNVRLAINNLQEKYKESGIVLVFDGEKVSLGTHPELSGLIEEMQKEELSRELGKAGLETLSIVLYKNPISRREIDYIRGVNSSFILRNLLIRGLIERTEGVAGERSYTYKPTLELMRYLGLTRTEDLPKYEESQAKMVEFAKREKEENAD